MATALVTKNGRARQRATDPVALMRNIFGFDPFFAPEARVTRAQVFMPSFEVKEQDDSYVLVADMPGVKEADLDISLHDNVLTISGSRQAEERKEGDTYYLYERQYGSFSRSFSLPEEANTEGIEAKLDNGVLRVTIGKRAESKPRKIGLKK
jgi:HSP20 family protein